MRKEEELERNAPRGKRARGHVREGAEACGRGGARIGGSGVRQRVANGFPAGGGGADLDQAVGDVGGPDNRIMDRGFGVGRKDGEYVGGDSGDRNDSWNSSSTGETDLWCLVGEEAMVVEDAEEVGAWHDGAGGSLGDQWGVTSADEAAGAFGDWISTTAEPTSNKEFDKESWTWKSKSQREEAGAWDHCNTEPAATSDTWISDPDYNQQKEGTWNDSRTVLPGTWDDSRTVIPGTWDDSRTVIPGAWDDSRTVIPDFADTWGCKPEQLHEVGTWVDTSTPITAVTERYARHKCCCTCSRSPEDGWWSSDSDSGQQAGF